MWHVFSDVSEPESSERHYKPFLLSTAMMFSKCHVLSYTSDVILRKLENLCMVSIILKCIFFCKNVSIVFTAVGFQVVDKITGETKAGTFRTYLFKMPDPFAFLLFLFVVLHPVGEITSSTLFKALAVHFSGGYEENNGNVSRGIL